MIKLHILTYVNLSWDQKNHSADKNIDTEYLAQSITVSRYTKVVKVLDIYQWFRINIC